MVQVAATGALVVIVVLVVLDVADRTIKIMKKELNDRFVTLTLTNMCNLNCTYCYEVNKSNRKMSFETAKSIIDSEFQNGIEKDLFLHFSLFGGEPFLEFDLICKIVDYIEKNYSNYHKYNIDITTNGTLVHGEVQEWLKEHKKAVYCALSLDGTKEMHDTNRSNSFDKIDLDFFLSMYPKQSIKMTISQETLPKLAEGVIYCSEKGFDIFCNLAYGIDWSNKDNISILNNQLAILIDYYLNNPDVKPCSMLSDQIFQLGMDYPNSNVKKWCATGDKMASYDTDGKKYPCQFFMPLSCGEEKSKKAKEFEFYDEIPVDLLDEKCRNCIVNRACPTCYGSNYVSTGSLYKKEDNYCILTKNILFARSFFHAKLWELGRLKLSEDDEQALLRSIILIQENLGDI